MSDRDVASLAIFKKQAEHFMHHFKRDRSGFPPAREPGGFADLAAPRNRVHTGLILATRISFPQTAGQSGRRQPPSGKIAPTAGLFRLS